jgi:hypothetical protein
MQISQKAGLSKEAMLPVCQALASTGRILQQQGRKGGRAIVQLHLANRRYNDQSIEEPGRGQENVRYH